MTDKTITTTWKPMNIAPKTGVEIKVRKLRRTFDRLVFWSKAHKDWIYTKYGRCNKLDFVPNGWREP